MILDVGMDRLASFTTDAGKGPSREDLAVLFPLPLEFGLKLDPARQGRQAHLHGDPTVWGADPLHDSGRLSLQAESTYTHILREKTDEVVRPRHLDIHHQLDRDARRLAAPQAE